MKYLFTLTAFVILLANPNLGLAAKRVPCGHKTDEIVCRDDPDCQWDAKRSRCITAPRVNDPCSAHNSEFYCEANKCHWHRLASKCATIPSEVP